jgi:hypothetical protein
MRALCVRLPCSSQCWEVGTEPGGELWLDLVHLRAPAGDRHPALGADAEEPAGGHLVGAAGRAIAAGQAARASPR